MCGRRVGQEELALDGVAEDARDLEGYFATGYKTLQVPRIGKIAMVDVRLSPRIARDRLHDTLGFAVLTSTTNPFRPGIANSSLNTKVNLASSTARSGVVRSLRVGPIGMKPDGTRCSASTAIKERTWSSRFSPTPGRSSTGSTPIRRSRSRGPTPLRWRICGEL